MNVLEFMQYSLAGFLTLLELSFIILIWIGAGVGISHGWRGINLEKVVSEENGSASFSRFQFLVFTFVVASAYIICAFHAATTTGTLPGIDPSVLGLIGISGGSYLISKGIETSTTDSSSDTPAESANKPKTQNWPN